MPYNRRSKLITQGVARSPNRAMLRAVGFGDDDFEKPIVGVANGHSTMNPCNAGIQPLVDRAAAAIKEAGAMPQLFGTPTVTGGMAFAWDPDDCLPLRLNPESVISQRMGSAHWEGVCRGLIEEHARETGSRHAERILAEWERERLAFWQVVRKEMIHRLAHPLAMAAE